ncbi:secreted protein, partial [gut metagenome]
MKLLNRLSLLGLLLLLPLTLCAQKKQIQVARDQVKAGKELAKVVASMQGLLSDSANRQNPRIWLVLCDALKVQYEQ